MCYHSEILRVLLQENDINWLFTLYILMYMVIYVDLLMGSMFLKPQLVKEAETSMI